MSKNLLGLLVLGMAVLVSGCAVFITPSTPTTIKAQNSLTAMSVDVGGTTTHVNGIDLVDVTIGDIVFSSIDYGTTTAAVTTHRSGNVAVDIGTAVVWTTVLGQATSVSFTNISPMSATITAETENTVDFDQSTASVIFQALAKKKAS
jgi:hypothetical protein